MRDVWEEEGQKTMGDRIQEKIRTILENHRVPALSDSVLGELESLKREGEKEFINVAFINFNFQYTL